MRVVTFGEVMLRLAPEENLRLRQSLPGRLESTFGGGELNVAVSVAFQGGESAFLTSVPDNPITDALEQEMKKLGVATDLLQRTCEGRFGIYFVEVGANQRGSTVTYDRSESSVSITPASAYDWVAAFKDSDWFHITGITPAISEAAAEAALESVKAAKKAGLTVSCDLNYRKKLWKWEAGTKQVDLARRTMRNMMPYFDVVIANEEDADLSLGIAAPKSNVESGTLNIDGYQLVAKQIVSEFPNVKKVAITLRESYSSDHNNWGGLLYDAESNELNIAPRNEAGEYQSYPMHNIVDRVGAGDSFAGALIFALRTEELSNSATAIRYAVAGSCLKHSIKGDFNYSTRGEIEALMNGAGSGRVQR